MGFSSAPKSFGNRGLPEGTCDTSAARCGLVPCSSCISRGFLCAGIVPQIQRRLRGRHAAIRKRVGGFSHERYDAHSKRCVGRLKIQIGCLESTQFGLTVLRTSARCKAGRLMTDKIGNQFSTGTRTTCK